MTWNYFFHMYMDESPKWMKCLDENGTSMNFLDDNYM
jgi:hypothetical protein